MFTLLAALSLTCNYQFMQIPFAGVSIVFNDDGSFPDAAEVSMQGRKHLESLTPEPLGEGERYHFWISKESAENAIEMRVLEGETPELRSVIINHKMPMGKEVWGTCVQQ